MENAGLEFEINGKILTIADMDWHIDGIEYIYVDKDATPRYREYNIFIKTSMDLVKLYYKNEYFDDCYRECGKLCKAIKKVNPTFNKIPGNPRYLDFSKVEKIKLSKPIRDKLVFTLKNNETIMAPINFECAKDRYRLAVQLLNESRQQKEENICKN